MKTLNKNLMDDLGLKATTAHVENYKEVEFTTADNGKKVSLLNNGRKWAVIYFDGEQFERLSFVEKGKAKKEYVKIKMRILWGE